MDKVTKWTGKLLDAAGRVGKIEMEVAEGGRGSFRLELQERDGHPVALKGEVNLAAEGDVLKLRSSAESEQQGGGKAEWQATLSRADAGRYAKSSMMGTFGVTGTAPGIPLTNGVVILWQFS